MTIQPIANQMVAPLNLPQVLKQMPHLFENIAANFDPQSMKNFCCTCKTIWQIAKDFKAKYPKTYFKLLDQIFPHGFRKKSIEELSDEIIELCTNTSELQSSSFRLRQRGEFSDEEIAQYQKLQVLELKDLLNALTASGKFNKINKVKLGKAFFSACTYTHAEMVDLLLHSDIYHAISIECLNRSFGRASSDDGTTIRTLINSDRFLQIGPKSLGKALGYASINGHPGVVQAIMESGRADEISLETFSEALMWAAENGETETGTYLKTLRMLMQSPQFNKVSPEDLGYILVRAASNWRGNSVQEFVRCSRYHEISTERLNQTFSLCLKKMNTEGDCGIITEAVKAIIYSNRFHEINVQLRIICYSKLGLKESMKMVYSNCSIQ